MAQQKQKSKVSVRCTGRQVTSNILKSSKEQLDSFEKTMEQLVDIQLNAKDDPFGLESAIKYPKETYDDKDIVEKLTIAQNFMKTNGVQIDQMIFCPLDGYDDREPKFSGLYPEFRLTFRCKDKKGDSWQFDMFCSVKK